MVEIAVGLEPDRGTSLNGGDGRRRCRVGLVAANQFARDIRDLWSSVNICRELYGSRGTDRHVGLVVLGLADILPVRRDRAVEDEVGQRVCVSGTH